MVPPRKGLLRLAAAAAAIALAVTGCGSGGDDGSGSGTALPDDQQKLTYVPNFGVQGLDITKYPLEIGVNMVVSQVLQPLVKIDKDKKIQPDLAQSWEWSDPTTLVFHLRKGVKFSDGQDFTAKDVKGSLDRYIAAKQALAAVLAPIASYEATDDYTFTIKTKQPVGTLVGVLSMVYIGEGSHATDDAWWSKPVGTGPFVFSDYVANDHISFSRNDNYWGQKAKLKTLTIKLITDVNGKITALTNNEVQVVGDVPFDQIATVKNADGLSFTQSDSLNYWFLWFENAHTPLDNVKVRKAMWEALDLPTIITSLYGDTVTPMKSYCPVSAFGCPPATGMPKYDQADAKKLLADAGYPNGFSVDIIFNTANAGVNNLVQSFISAWKAVGITVNPRGEDPATWLADFNALKWDMDTQPNQTITGDADYTLNRLYQCAAKRLGYCNADLDQLMQKAQQSTDQSARQGLYQQVVNKMAEDVPAIPLFEVKVNVATRANVKGLVIPPNEFTDFSTVYLTQ